MSEIRIVAFCPHCGNTAPQKLLHTQQYRKVLKEDYGYVREWQVGYCYVVNCETCHQILLYRSIAEDRDDRNFSYYSLCWPTLGKLHESVPQSVSEIYKEATRIKVLAPNAFAVQTRRALEAICEDRGAKKGVLQVRLKELCDRGEIPPILAEVTDVLRLLGNIGAHASDQSVTPSQADALDEFFRVVVEYVYVAPSKLKELRESLRKI